MRAEIVEGDPALKNPNLGGFANCCAYAEEHGATSRQQRDSPDIRSRILEVSAKPEIRGRRSEISLTKRQTELSAKSMVQAVMTVIFLSIFFLSLYSSFTEGFLCLRVPFLGLARRLHPVHLAAHCRCVPVMLESRAWE